MRTKHLEHGKEQGVLQRLRRIATSLEEYAKLNEEREKRKEEKEDENLKYIRLMAKATMVGVLVAFLAFVAAGVNAVILDFQLKESRDTDRPWIETSVSMVDQIDFTKQNPQMHIDIRMRNVGHLPAFSVVPSAWYLIGGTIPYEPMQGQSQKCKSHWQGLESYDPDGFVLFPGDYVDVQRYVTIYPGKIKQALQFGKGQKSINLSVVACVQYMGGDYKTTHHTDIIYSITNDADTVTANLVPHSIVPNGIVQKSNIQLNIYPIYGSNAD